MVLIVLVVFLSFHRSLGLITSISSTTSSSLFPKFGPELWLEFDNAMEFQGKNVESNEEIRKMKNFALDLVKLAHDLTRPKNPKGSE